MNRNRKTTCVAAALLALCGAASAADQGHGNSHSGTPPASSNNQSLDDADRGQDRADERQSDAAERHSNAPGKKGTNTPDHGMEHRDMDHSMGSHGKGWKNPAE